MKKLALSLCLIPFLASAVEIKDIVNKTYENNKHLQGLQKVIDISKQDIKLSSKYQNPILTIGANDIYFDEPLTRDKEAMQAQYIAISQNFESSDKLLFKEKISKASKEEKSYLLDEKKLILKSNIYANSWKILTTQEKIKILKEYEQNIQKLIDLASTYYEVGRSNQNDILKLKIDLVNNNIKIKNLQNSVDNLFLDLQKISYENIEKIDDNENLKSNIDLKIDYETHPKIKILDAQINKFNLNSKLEDEKKFSDFKVTAAYFNRDSKFKDYANISVSIPLAFNDRENIEVIKSKLNAKAKKDEVEDLKNEFKSQIKTIKNNLNTSYVNYELIVKTILPMKEDILKNIENYNTFNKADLNTQIKSFNEILDYELKAIEFKEDYFTNLAKSIYYTQGLNND